MKDFNMDDYSALKGSTLIKGLAGSEQLRFDSVESATVFFARELDQVKTKTYDKQYPELSALANFPITSEVNEGAETTTYYSYDITGMAAIINNYATDLPRVDIQGESHTANIKSIGDSYGYNVQEMRASKMAGKSLDARKGAAARRASDYMVNKIAFAGDKKHNLVGIFSDGTDIPLYTLSEVEVGGEKYTDWAHKTADQILEDLNGMQMFIDKITMSIEKPDTLALPSHVYMDLATRRIPDTAFADLRGQLEQWRQRWRFLCQSEQSPLECELEHRLPLRSAFKSDTIHLMGIWSVQRCKGFRLLCSRKKSKWA